MQINHLELEFAYKYPFSLESRRVISESGKDLDYKLFNYGLLRLQNSIDKKSLAIDDSLLDSTMLIHILSYVYARMIVSANGNQSIIKLFCYYEAKRSIYALLEDKQQNIEKITGELGIKIQKNNNFFLITFEDYLKNMPKTEEFRLISLHLFM